jgi:hypothetical protein
MICQVRTVTVRTVTPPPKCEAAGPRLKERKLRRMMIDEETLKQLLRINDELLQLCKWLNESAIWQLHLALYRSWATHTLLLEAARNKLQ